MTQLIYSEKFIQSLGVFSQKNTIADGFSAYDEHFVAGFHKAVNTPSPQLNNTKPTSWYGKLWKQTLAWINGPNMPAFISSIVDVVADKLDGVREFSSLVVFFLSNELSWRDMITAMFSANGIDPEMSLKDHRYNNWAHGKTYILGVAASVGAAETFVSYDQEFDKKQQSASSTFRFSNGRFVKTYYPACFSHKIGSTGDAPRPFMHLPHGAKLFADYKFMETKDGQGTSDEVKTAEVKLDYINRHNNEVALADASGSASAFAGCLNFSEPIRYVQSSKFFTIYRWYTWGTRGYDDNW